MFGEKRHSLKHFSIQDGGKKSSGFINSLPIGKKTAIIIASLIALPFGVDLAVSIGTDAVSLIGHLIFALL
jgi:hypothetical protein